LIGESPVKINQNVSFKQSVSACLSYQNAGSPPRKNRF